MGIPGIGVTAMGVNHYRFGGAAGEQARHDG
jgi:hypothetical protein